jgi:hypothetical protein
MLCWGGNSKETSITVAMQPNLFQRGDKIRVSGFVNSNNGLFVVRRAMGTSYIVQPADWWDYLTHYASKFWNEVQWKFWGVVNNLEDVWNRLLEKLKRLR